MGVVHRTISGSHQCLPFRIARAAFCFSLSAKRVKRGVSANGNCWESRLIINPQRSSCFTRVGSLRELSASYHSNRRFKQLIKPSPIDFDATSNELPNTRGFRFLLFSMRERSTLPISPEIPADFDIIIIRGALLGIGTLHGSPVSRNQTFLVVLLGNDRGDRSIDPIWKHRGENSFGLLGLEFNLFS